MADGDKYLKLDKCNDVVIGGMFYKQCMRYSVRGRARAEAKVMRQSGIQPTDSASLDVGVEVCSVVPPRLTQTGRDAY